MKLAPISKYALKAARARLQHFKKSLRHAAKHPQDPDAVHDLRVSIRRLTQCFRTFRDLFVPAPVKKLRRRLHKVMEHCAAARNCDIALDLLHQVGIAEGASVLKLEKKREAAVRRLERRLKKERSKRHAAPGASQRPSDGGWKLDQSPEDSLRILLPALAEEFFAAGEVAAGAGVSARALHQFRLRAKRFRYTLEIFERFYGREMASGEKALKGMQDRLGAVNDCATTIELLGRDRRAVAAVRRQMGQRRAEFQAYWQSQFASRGLDWWKDWLSRPVPRDTASP